MLMGFYGWNKEFYCLLLLLLKGDGWQNWRDGWLSWRETGGQVEERWVAKLLGRWVAKLEGDGWLSWREMGGLVVREMGGWIGFAPACYGSSLSFCEFCGHKPFYSVSISGEFLGTSLPPSPNWSRFDLYIQYCFICISNYTLYFI